MKKNRIFDTDRRIRLGIWGLGRGMSFYNSCRALNFDVVAGCDYNAHMRENFLKANPGAFATADAKEFLARDFDAVLLATFCPAHADDAIACLKAGKHVLSEVTSFHTMEEGVRLVEAVEKSGKVYNLAENYPFSAANMWLARKWREGFFGDLMYAEYEYVHEVRALSYVYIDNTPIQPGNHAHSWRSWLNFHYYNTHSLGPMMHITGLRPTRVVALPAAVTLSGYPTEALHGMGGITPSLINMSNGSVVRNLMGATTSDSHHQRIWGTLAAAEIGHGQFNVRVGASGSGTELHVIPQWDDLGELAAQTGHGGGDFWVLYYFARHILFGQPGPFDIYGASDCTIPGILAYRSSAENGKPYDIPDFRDRAQREVWRNDRFAQPRFDHREGLFPKSQDLSITTHFSRTMRDLIGAATTYRAYRDARQLLNDLANPHQYRETIEALLGRMPVLQESQRMARKIIDRYPESVGGRVLRDMLDLSEPGVTSKTGFEAALRRELRGFEQRVQALLRKREASEKQPADSWHSPFISRWKLARLQRKTKDGLKAVRPVKPSDASLEWRDLYADGAATASPHLVNLHTAFGDLDGIALAATRLKVARTGTWDLKLGHDGGARVFVDGKEVLCQPARANPAVADRTVVPVRLTKGTHSLLVALDTDNGNGWGFFLRFAIPKAQQKKTSKPVFPISAM
jgi:predicted dehydrogenase